MKKKERENERMKRRQRRRLFAFTAASDFDLLRKGDSWIFPNSPAGSALRGRHRRKCQSLPLSLSLGKMMPRLPQQLTDEIKTKSALEPSFPHTSPPFLMPLIVFWCRQRQFIFTKLLNHRFPEAHYNVFHGCIISTQKEPKSFDGLEILYFFYEI